MRNKERGFFNGKIAIGIVRVSTSEQAQEERYSIPHQKAHIADECKRRGLQLMEIFAFVQSGAKILSGSSRERIRIIEFIKQHGVEVVMVHELDRLARSMVDTLLFVDELNRLGVSFISIHDGFDTTTAQGQLQMHILAAFAEYFRKQLAGKVRDGMIERAKQGKPLGRYPFGYEPGPAGLRVKESEAKVVRLIFSLYVEQNIGLRAIADRLNRLGYKTRRGLAWSHVSVKEVLENEAYTGTFSWSNIKLRFNHPALIDPPTWEAAQKRRRRKKELGGRAQNSFYLLSGLLYCGNCSSSKMTGRTSRKGKYCYRYYICSNYASKGIKACSSGYIRAGELEGKVFADLVHVALRYAGSIDISGLLNSTPAVKEEIKLKQKELAALNAMLVRAAAAYEQGAYGLKWFLQRKSRLTQEMTAIKQEIERLQRQDRLSQPTPEITKKIKEKIITGNDLLPQAYSSALKARLQELIERIEVCDRQNFTVYYRLKFYM